MNLLRPICTVVIAVGANDNDRGLPVEPRADKLRESYHKGVGGHSWGQGRESCQLLHAQETDVGARVCHAKDILKELASDKDLGGSNRCPHHR